MMKNCTTTKGQLERVVEQIFTTPVPQILEELIELEEIVDIPVLQIEFILFSGRSFSFFFCCGMVRCILICFF